MAVVLNVRPPAQLHLSDPQRTRVGRAILTGGISLLNRLGLEDFTFRKLAVEINSSEASVYRYFSNKNQLLLYLTSWYWDWVAYLIGHTVSRERDPAAKLRAAIRVLTHPHGEQTGPGYIDQCGLHRLMVSEGTKAYRTKLVDRKQSDGLFQAYHKLTDQLSQLILGVNPGFAHPRALASSLFEMAHDHSYFARHLPRLTDVGPGENTSAELTAMILSWTGKLLDRPDTSGHPDKLAAPYTVFITRTLRPDSPLRRWAARTKNLVCGKSLLAFGAVPFTPPKDVDWWFFYSPRAVEFALADHTPPENVRLAALGEGTAQTLRAHSGRVDFVGRGSPGQVARQFLKLAKNQRVFFPRAEHSRQSIQRELADQITILDAVCYSNAIRTDVKPIRADVIVFTSPRNVSAYLDRYQLPDGARLIAIGGVTAAALYQRGFSVPFPELPSEAAIAHLLDNNYPS